MNKLDTHLFHNVDIASRSFRQIVQMELKNSGLVITIDQWIVLKCIFEKPNISITELSEILVKDSVSVKRFIYSLIKSGYLIKRNGEENLELKLIVTDLGYQTIERTAIVIMNCSKIALKGIGIPKERHVKIILKTIANNCIHYIR